MSSPWLFCRYTYDLTHSLQYNLTRMSPDGVVPFAPNIPYKTTSDPCTSDTPATRWNAGRCATIGTNDPNDKSAPIATSDPNDKSATSGTANSCEQQVACVCASCFLKWHTATRYVWNAHMLAPLVAVVQRAVAHEGMACAWLCPLVHGFVAQACTPFSFAYSLPSLIPRRYWHMHFSKMLALPFILEILSNRPFAYPLFF